MAESDLAFWAQEEASGMEALSPCGSNVKDISYNISSTDQISSDRTNSSDVSGGILSVWRLMEPATKKDIAGIQF